jgi:hypothetical protein
VRSIPALVILFLLDSFFDSGIIGRAAGPGRGQQQLNMMFGDGPPRERHPNSLRKASLQFPRMLQATRPTHRTP